MVAIKLIRQDDFTGGLNLRADPFQLAENESPDMLNVEVDPRGGFFTRDGALSMNTTRIGGIADFAFTPDSLVNWSRGSAQLVAGAGTSVFYSTDGATWVDTTISVGAGSGATFAPWSGASSDVLYVSCGSTGTQMAKWSGSSKTLLTASGAGAWQESLTSPSGSHMPKADFVASHVDRMWVASTNEGGTVYPNRVRFSHPNFPESWRSSDYIDIVSGGSGITALVPFGDSLLVFKRNSIHAIYGVSTDNFQVVMLTTELGTPSFRAVATAENRIFFFDWPRGVFSWNGRQFDDLFVKLRPAIQKGELTATTPGKSFLSWSRDRLWLSPYTAASPAGVKTTFMFDPTVQAWTKFTLGDGYGIGPQTDFVKSNGERLYVGLHGARPYCLKLDDTGLESDSIGGVSVGFESRYTTRWYDGGVVSQKKAWRQPDFVVGQVLTDLPLTIEVFRDWEEAAPRRTQTLLVNGTGVGLIWAEEAAEPDGIPGWGEAVWSEGVAGSQHERGQRLGLCRSVQLRISAPPGRAWSVNSITFKYTPRRVR